MTPWLIQEIEGCEIVDGYATGPARLWDEGGHLCAIVTQTAQVYGGDQCRDASRLAAVGPRPEQTLYLEELRQKLPFYDARHWSGPAGPARPMSSTGTLATRATRRRTLNTNSTTCATNRSVSTCA